MPKSLEAYYQEAGRAGRDGCDADCILLYAPQDVITARWLIEHSDPNPDLTPEEQAQVRDKEEERLKSNAMRPNRIPENQEAAVKRRITARAKPVPEALWPGKKR